MKKKKGFVNGWMEKQTKKTKKEVRRQISREEIMILTGATFFVAFMQIAGMLLNMHQWATTNPDFGSYNYYAPFVALIGWLGYVYVLVMKGVHERSFLPYVPAITGIIYSLVLTFIRWNMMDPSVLKFW